MKMKKMSFHDINCKSCSFVFLVCSHGACMCRSCMRFFFINTYLLGGVEGFYIMVKVQHGNRIKPRMYVRRITRSSLYEKAPYLVYSLLSSILNILLLFFKKESFFNSRASSFSYSFPLYSQVIIKGH